VARICCHHNDAQLVVKKEEIGVRRKNLKKQKERGDVPANQLARLGRSMASDMGALIRYAQRSLQNGRKNPGGREVGFRRTQSMRLLKTLNGEEGQHGKTGIQLKENRPNLEAP